MSPEEADYLLDEWARWARDDNTLTVHWFRDRSPFYVPGGVLPTIYPVDSDRAFMTDRTVARLSGRRRFIVKLNYLDRSPIDSKARRLRMGRESYRELVKGICRVVADSISRSAT